MAILARWLTKSQVLEEYKPTRRKLKMLVDSGIVRTRREGALILYSRDSLDKYSADCMAEEELKRLEILKGQDEEERMPSWKRERSSGRNRLSLGNCSILEEEGARGTHYYLDFYDPIVALETKEDGGRKSGRQTKSIRKLAKEYRLSADPIIDRSNVVHLARKIRIIQEEQNGNGVGSVKIRAEIDKAKMTFSQFARSYLRLAERENRNTFKAKQSVIDGKKEETPSLIEYFGNRLLVDIDLQAVQEYVFMLRSKGLADSTISNRLSILKTMLNKAEDLGHKIDARKIVKMKSFKLKKNKRIRVLKKAEAERLFAKADEFWKTLLSFSLNTGLRLSNVCDLRWEHVDLDERMFTIPPADMKNNDWLNIPMSPIVHAMLERLRASNGTHEHVFMRKANGSGEVPLSPRWVQRELQRLLEEAEIEDFHFHDLRHTCGQTMYDNGADLLTIKNCLGHRSIQSTMVYVHGNRERVKEAFSSLNKECWNAYATN